MASTRLGNVGLRLRGKSLVLVSVVPPFRTADWGDAEALTCEMDFPGISAASLACSVELQERFLEALAASMPEGLPCYPDGTGLRSWPLRAQRREILRRTSRLVKFVAECRRDVVIAALEALAGQLAARGTVEVQFRAGAGADCGADEWGVIADACNFLVGIGRWGAPVLLLSQLQRVAPSLWDFIYRRSQIRIGWEGSDLLNCRTRDELDRLADESPALKNLREIGGSGLWPHIILPISGANVCMVPELVAALLELTRGASIEIIPVPFVRALGCEAVPPQAREYAEALLEVYRAPNVPLRLVSPLSWVAARIDSQQPLVRSALSAGAEGAPAERRHVCR